MVPSPLRVLSVGAGAIGSYIGGNLALQGHQVVFLEQPHVAQEIRQRGLILEQEGEIKQLSNPIVASSVAEALDLGEYELALFALKSFDTLPVVQILLPYRDQLPPFLCLQNGVDNEFILSEAFGEDKVIAATVTSAIGRRGVGQAVLERKRGIGIAANHPLSQRLESCFNAAGLNCRLYPRPADMKWSKMLTNLLANASSAILNMTPAQIFSNPALFQMEIRQIREALSVMAAKDIHPVDLPGTPVVALAFAVRRLPLWLSRPLLIRAVGSGRGAKMPSFHLDLYAGRGKSEVEFLNGAIARDGEAYGIPTPVNRFLTETLKSLTEGKIPLDTYAGKPDKFLDDLAKNSLER